MCVWRRQGLDSLCDRQQRDRKPSPHRPRRNRGGSGPDRQGHEQQVQGNERGRPGPFSGALLIESSFRRYWKSGIPAASARVSRLPVPNTVISPWLFYLIQNATFGKRRIGAKCLRQPQSFVNERSMMLANCVSIKLKVTLILTALTFFTTSADGQSTPIRAVNSDKPTVAAQGPRSVNQ